MIKIRAHHLVCIPKFYRGGYNKKFAKNMKKSCMIIRKNHDTKIKVVVGELDDLCRKCPYSHNKKCVQSKIIEKWVITQDKKIMKFLELKPNKIYQAKEIFNLSISKINKKSINKICEGCIFLKNCIKVGINKSFQKDLNKKCKS